MKRFTSGIYGVHNEWYAVNEEYYNIEDDKSCLSLSLGYHKINNVDIENSINSEYIIKYLYVEYVDIENSSAINITELDNPDKICCICRVYKLITIPSDRKDN